ncbi:ABC transporter permease [uncultured Parabacteroides sp.]|uniref:ABC transporter permease n=1 Tax=uncultured Parabacteroides sp. TaxID=512312 RepID=UPI0025F33BDA|nr:ABC transporter permease [uncultured Parabacteroides sp.]
MLALYLKIAFRNMWKYRTQSLTGIFGLAFGLACFVPALYWMYYETSYDSSYPEAENIYRIYGVDKQSGNVNKSLSKVYEKTLCEQFPAVEASAVCITGQEENCRTDNIPYVRLSMLYAENAFFDVFPQKFICGDAERPLQVIDNIVLTETMATRLFGDPEKAIGQQVQNTIRADWPPYTVTAVVEDPPANSNFSFDAIIYSNMVKQFAEIDEKQQWGLFFFDLYVKLNPHADAGALAGQVRDLTSRLGTNANVELRMLPIGDIRHHLNSDAPFTLNFIGLFVASGILLLLSTVFNFLNLHLDFFRQRLRELHLRRVNGATGGQLIRQMLFELACSTLIALLLACLLVILVRPAFSGLLDIEIGVSQLVLFFLACSAVLLASILLVGVVAFWRLSRLAMLPVSERENTRQPVLRRMAVTLQLAVSVVFILAASVVMMQMRFVNHKDLGFDRNGVIQLSGFQDYSGKVEAALIEKLKAVPQVETLTDAYFEPRHEAPPYYLSNRVEWPGEQSSANSSFYLVPADERFAATFRLKLLHGKWWEEGQMRKVVLNEEAVRVMGLRDPVGTVIRMPLPEDNSIVDYEVVGVVKDFHLLSLRNRIQPALFFPSSRLFNILYLRIVPGQEMEAIRRVMEILPEVDVTLADARLTPIGDLYDDLNRSEQAGLKMFSVLAVVCLLISLFGIYAVASAATQRRRKEIAVRKVVGAKVGDIVRMFFREYTVQVMLAGVVALPLAYIAMSRWLQGYAYRTDIPVWLLAGVITGVVAVVLLTVLGQVLRAANSNPAEVVKSE